ncbi:MAG: alpha-glucosidase [Spirochaetes bacterium]|nr:MAG: alpha-glucosidase [Spirochaetota bacterium]
MKIVLIGAGSAQFGLGTVGDIFQSTVLKNAHIVLVDINEKALNQVLQKTKNHIERHRLPFTISATISTKEALKKADFVIISIEAGNRFELWDMDWKIPLQYGIRQVYGENGGAGGLFHALRITPSIIDICADVERLCPDAFVFNYSNPMTAITTTVLRKFPGLKFIGLCHEITSLRRYIPNMLGVPYEDLRLRAGGLNHLSVLVEAHYRDSGRDAYPEILEKAPGFLERAVGYSDLLKVYRENGKLTETEGVAKPFTEDIKESAYSWADRKLFKLILTKYNLFPITVDSHLGEYIHWAHSVVDHRGILDFYDLYRSQLANSRDIEIASEVRERVIPIMEGIVEDSGYEESAVDILNDGYIPDLPSWLAVEVPAFVTAKGVTGIPFRSYPKGFAALLRNYSGVYDLTAEAVLTGRRDYVIQALLANPVVTDVTHIDEMVDIMIERQRPWLDYIK